MLHSRWSKRITLPVGGKWGNESSVADCMVWTNRDPRSPHVPVPPGGRRVYEYEGESRRLYSRPPTPVRRAPPKSVTLVPPKSALKTSRETGRFQYNVHARDASDDYAFEANVTDVLQDVLRDDDGGNYLTSQKPFAPAPPYTKRTNLKQAKYHRECYDDEYHSHTPHLNDSARYTNQYSSRPSSALSTARTNISTYRGGVTGRPGSSYYPKEGYFYTSTAPRVQTPYVEEEREKWALSRYDTTTARNSNSTYNSKLRYPYATEPLAYEDCDDDPDMTITVKVQATPKRDRRPAESTLRFY